jgi:hypothetical protein
MVNTPVISLLSPTPIQQNNTPTAWEARILLLSTLQIKRIPTGGKEVVGLDIKRFSPHFCLKASVIIKDSNPMNILKYHKKYFMLLSTLVPGTKMD